MTNCIFKAIFMSHSIHLQDMTPSSLLLSSYSTFKDNDETFEVGHIFQMNLTQDDHPGPNDRRNDLLIFFKT